MKFQVDNLKNVFITSDHHFEHNNIIKYCERPFSDVHEMDNTLIDNWNSVVRPHDQVFHLGDFSLGEPETAKEYFSELNGRITVLTYTWHHDKYWLQGLLYQESKSGHAINLWPPMVVLEIDSMGKDSYPLAITLCHYPMALWDRKHYGAWHIHGHIHSRGLKRNEKIFDAGVDNCNYSPISLQKISEIIG